MKDELKELTFTAYVRLLSDDGTPPTVEAFDAVLRRLAGALRFEMRRRSLWSSPPSYVGIYGGERWTEDLFEELLLDCYAFIFVRRIVGLKNQAEVREDIDGLVFLNIRNFLHEAQQRCDPIGYLVFDRLHGAVRQLLDRGTLSLLDGDPRIRNDTVLGFAAGGETVFPKDAPDDLGALVASWVPGLLPDLVTSRDQEAVVEQLAARLELLPGAGFDVFRFYDVVDPLKHHIRLHWFQLAAGDTDAATQRSSEDFERLVRLVWPQQGIEDRDFFDKLVECVEESLARVPGTRKKRRYLEQLWSYLRAWAAEPGHARGEGKGGPPHLRIAKLLGIPRGRIPELKEELGEVIERCRERLSALAGGPRGSKGGNGDGEGGPMSAGDRRDRLRLATAEALAARAAEPRAPEATAGREVVPGHRFVVARVRAYPAEWLVVYRDGDRVQVVPVDDHPLRGSADEALAEEGLQAESRARCGLADWVGVGVFDDARPTGRIPASLLEAVRLRCAAVAGSRLEPSAVERSVDTSAAYRDLIEMLQRAVSELRTPGSKREPEPPASAQAPTRFEDPSRDRDASSRVGYALAAGLTLAVLGLGLWSAHLAIELDKATQPYVTPAGQAVDVVFGETGRGVELSVGSANPRVVLRLSLARIAVRPSYRLELLSETSQQVIWRSGSVARDAELSLVLPTRLLAPGEYRLRIFAADAEASDAPIAEETLRVRRQPR